jgi:predicted transcriptional regulator/transcriptional regulator with XRE-family HTH domain
MASRKHPAGASKPARAHGAQGPPPPRRRRAAGAGAGRKLLLGSKLRSLRRDREMSQVELARRLGISASYLNYIEHNQRAVTADLLLRLVQVFGGDLSSFTPEDEARLQSELAEMFGDPLFASFDLRGADIAEVASSSPAMGRAILALYRAWRAARDDRQAGLLPGKDGRLPAVGRPPPEDDVSDFVQDNLNHFPELETAAEQLARDADLGAGDIDRHLVEYLARVHRVRVDVVPSDLARTMVRRYDPAARRLLLSEVLPPRSRSFQLAHQIALLGFRPVLDRALAQGRLGGADSEVLARVALANYFAGAVLMPYEAFLSAARSVRYDIELLGHRFRTSYEQVCHRLTTLQRPGAAGVPFHMIRVDIAGNISKRFSASGIRFARYSGSCPRWNVHTAFLSPGFIRTQLSQMPDGTSYFCMARTVRKEGGGFRVPQSRLAIGLGCEVRYARELVYADGVELGNLDAAVPIGVTCRLCERLDCRQRAFPPLQQGLSVDENIRGLSFYVSPGGSGAGPEH